MQSVRDILSTKHFTTAPVTKHQYEFQEICEALEPTYGKLIWTLPHKKGVTEYRLREAAKIARKRGNLTYPYLIGIIKRLP